MPRLRGPFLLIQWPDGIFVEDDLAEEGGWPEGILGLRPGDKFGHRPAVPAQHNRLSLTLDPGQELGEPRLGLVRVDGKHLLSSLIN